MNARAILFVVGVAIMSGCSTGDADRSDAVAVPKSTTTSSGNDLGSGGSMIRADWASNPCAKVEPMSAFVSLSDQAVDRALGLPSADQRFSLGPGMNEFRIELLNLFPLPANAALQIRERTWARGDCRLTLWAVQRDGAWTVVHAIRWPAGTAF